jgi:2-iminobutanoate/2-iminopropanoate deaminase
MIRYISTTDAPAPFSRYSQAVEVTGGARLVFVSGQVGVRADGTLAETEQGQHEEAWKNLLAILKSEGLGPRDIVDLTVYLTDRNALPLFRQVRDRMLEGAEPASTLLFVSGLANPDWHVEIQAVAAAAPR